MARRTGGILRRGGRSVSFGNAGDPEPQRSRDIRQEPEWRDDLLDDDFQNPRKSEAGYQCSVDRIRRLVGDRDARRRHSITPPDSARVRIPNIIFRSMMKWIGSSRYLLHSRTRARFFSRMATGSPGILG